MEINCVVDDTVIIILKVCSYYGMELEQTGSHGIAYNITSGL